MGLRKTRRPITSTSASMTLMALRGSSIRPRLVAKRKGAIVPRKGELVYVYNRIWSHASAISRQLSRDELFEYNRLLIRRLSPGFTTLWTEDHLQLGATATHECSSLRER